MGLLYHPTDPMECPKRPPDEFNVAIFQAHINRAKTIFEEMIYLLEAYGYAISWKDPLLTLSILTGLVWLCYRFNMEYIGRYVQILEEMEDTLEKNETLIDTGQLASISSPAGAFVLLFSTEEKRKKGAIYQEGGRGFP